MKLIYSPTSPYARKARIAIIERGIAGVELIPIDPFDPAAASINPNPLGKVPTLVLDDGSILFDSPLICAYLLQQGGHGQGTDPRHAEWDEMRRHALADGVIDAAFSIVMERRRPEGQRSDYWIDRWVASIHRAVRALEDEAARLGDNFGLGSITVASALGYLDFRLAEVAWRDDHPGLTAWFAQAQLRLSMIHTDPQG